MTSDEDGRENGRAFFCFLFGNAETCCLRAKYPFLVSVRRSREGVGLRNTDAYLPRVWLWLFQDNTIAEIDSFREHQTILKRTSLSVNDTIGASTSCRRDRPVCLVFATYIHAFFQVLLPVTHPSPSVLLPLSGLCLQSTENRTNCGRQARPLVGSHHHHLPLPPWKDSMIREKDGTANQSTSTKRGSG